MHRTTILLPVELREDAEAVAKDRGITLSELIREQLVSAVRKRKPRARETDVLFRPSKLMRAGGSGDMAARHDDYLYGHRRSGGAR